MSVRWLFLAVGMVAMALWFGRDAGLSLRQDAIVAVAAVLLAGACAWLVAIEKGEPGAADGGSKAAMHVGRGSAGETK